MNDDFKLGYAMGILVSQGSFTRDRKQAALQVKLHTRDEGLLDLLFEMFGGRIYGPYLHGERNYKIWLLRGDDLAYAVETLRTHLPESHKRQQFEAWYQEFFPVKEQSDEETSS